MTATKQLAPNTNDLLDEEALMKEARVLAWRRRRRRGLLAIALVAAAFLIAVGVDRMSSKTALSGHNDASENTGLTCPDARVKLLGVTSIPGAAVSAGILIHASISSSVACTMSGYPTIDARLSNLSTAMASDHRTGIFGGLPYSSKSNGAIPRILVTSHSRVVSFTVAFFSGNGPPCPRINSVQITLPGSRVNITARTMREGGMVGSQPLGSYCGYLSVTPLVSGSTGTALGSH